MKWEDPPPLNQSRTGKAWADEVGELKAHPKRWALLKVFPGEGIQTTTNASQFVRAIKTARYYAFLPAGHFEAVQRKIEEGTGVWARYVGKKKH